MKTLNQVQTKSVSNVTVATSKEALIARLIANAELDFGCCGHAKPKSKID